MGNESVHGDFRGYQDYSVIFFSFAINRGQQDIVWYVDGESSSQAM